MPAVGRLVPIGERMVLLWAAQVPANDDAESILHGAGKNPGAVAAAIGSLRGSAVA